MHLQRSRIVAFSAMAAGVLVVLGAVLLAPGRLRERWHLAQLDSDVPAVRTRALEELKAMGSRKLVARLIELPRRDPARTAFAVKHLADMGERAVPALEKALVNESVAIRRCAASTLITIDAAVAMDALLGALRHEDAEVREHAMIFLARLRLTDRERPALLQGLSDDSSAVRSAAAWTLGRAGLSGSIPALVEVLADESRDVRRRAVQALGRIRSAPETSIPAIGRLVVDESPVVRRAVVNALRLLGPTCAQSSRLTDDITSTLLVAVRDPVDDVWRPAVYGLGECGTYTTEVEAALRRITREGSPLLRPEARFALERLRQRANPAR